MPRPRIRSRGRTRKDRPLMRRHRQGRERPCSAEVVAAALAAEVSPSNRTVTNHRVQPSHASISPEKIWIGRMRSRDLLKQRTPIDDAPGIDAGKFEAFPDHGGNGVIDGNADLALQLRNGWGDPRIGADDRDRP